MKNQVSGQARASEERPVFKLSASALFLALGVLLVQAVVAQPLTITTLAGPVESPGWFDGTGSAARFNYPYGVAVDSSGNVYVADSGNQNVRKGVASLSDVAVIDSATGQTGKSRQLDTAPQTATTWLWSVVVLPSGSSAALSSTSIRNPTFTPDAAGTYVFRLRAESPSGMSITTVTLTATTAGKSEKSDDGGCSTGTGQSAWLALAALLTLALVSSRQFVASRG